MFEVRVHGRGGQGVVTTAALLSMAGFRDGRRAQAFPSFGSERTGAPVVAFCRLADGPIRLREPVMAPDALIVQDATLLHQVDVFAGLRPDGFLLVNSTRTAAELGITSVVDRLLPGHVAIVPASRIAVEHLGRPMPGVALLGAFAALTGQVSLPSISAAVHEQFTGAVAAGNAAAAKAAFDVETRSRAAC
ncbi:MULTISPECIES: 2-oxoacid:acceptor oxidoreductase family protein [unclassified Pseudonocardia]|jgi:pyruvate ferredoxin oxidoreductase gamma subunit|uniref:2-oxoacid:acceptor oxidoreductase family protein n=1 Tax=unclassified Pseudonocardia TaxID=2619320 RepID=UPI00095EE952|nr:MULTISPECIES: 2-oxoacid:acceptor oxidoreductase family protein [unclassified Pseudonocardia]MBN9096759.1 2-oxoacid:acceptor oxidoreductase family protein [Pseudonocardia sp.]OJY51785.1 MAG: 2-oxoacid:acceptor oxidoreductase [Pseudonocardia sp. 73-21]